MISKLVYYLGQSFRNPSLKKWLHFLKKSENWSFQELESYQLNKLKEIIEIAYCNSEYYKNSFFKTELKPSDIKKLSDLNKIPIISKSDLIINQAKNQNTNGYTKLFNSNTSGTSGKSLNFLRDESSDSFNRASSFRGYSWYKVNPWDRNGYFWGFNFSGVSKLKVKFLDSLQNRFRIFSFHPSEVQGFLKKISKARFIHGYSSGIYGVAKYINLLENKPQFSLKMVKGTSEKIFDSYQDEVKKAFGIKMISEYGAAETGIIAFECPKGNMHINMEGVIVEEIENEIIITNLQMLSFPIIRYRLGDYIKLASKETKCSCGMQHRILEEVTGRVGNLVYGKNQTYPSLYFYYIFKNLAKNKGISLTYQVQQQIKGELLFLIEQSLTKNELKILANEIEIYFKKDLLYEIKDSSEIRVSNKKIRSFISNID